MKNNLLKKIFFFLFVFLGLMFLMAVFYISRNFAFYNTNPLSQILFHMLVQVDGANPALLRGIIIQIVICPLIGASVIVFLLFSECDFLKKFQNICFIKYIKKWFVLLSAIFLISSFAICAKKLELVDYIKTYAESSAIYEDEYVDPKKVKFSIPENKRNLIYIFMESMETSDYSKQQGGAFDDCYIPELYDLAENNITFNDNKGFYVAPNTGWTVAAMIGQSSATPLTIPVAQNEFVTSNKFLPGVYSLGDLLNDNGYHNVLLIGSDATFGGRQYYYSIHGDYDIHDYNWALEKGLVTEDQFVWWGYEDYKLFKFAKDDLLELSKNEEPFSYTILTVDTHDDGYICKFCKDEYSERLANTYACTSRQVVEFVEWCKKQDFYENTTIVVVGDHCSMDEHFENLLEEFDRKVYFTILNPAEDLKETENRVICTFDLYPTTVASLGFKINGNRLGLGTNLFSNEQTLCEKYGKYEFFTEIYKYSKYYNNHILYGID